MAESADAPDLGSGGRPCRFDPCYPHHAKDPLKRVFCNDIRSFPIPQNSLRSFRGPLGAPERMIYASRMIYPSGMIYACGVLTGSPQNPRVLWGCQERILYHIATKEQYIIRRSRISYRVSDISFILCYEYSDQTVQIRTQGLLAKGSDLSFISAIRI